MGQKAWRVQKHGPVSQGLQCDEPIALAHAKGFSLLFKKSTNSPEELAQMSANKTPLVHKALSWT
eukprot:10691496-Lingulodinium_polyedra.AAC.1